MSVFVITSYDGEGEEVLGAFTTASEAEFVAESMGAHNIDEYEGTILVGSRSFYADGWKVYANEPFHEPWAPKKKVEPWRPKRPTTSAFWQAVR